MNEVAELSKFAEYAADSRTMSTNPLARQLLIDCWRSIVFLIKYNLERKGVTLRTRFCGCSAVGPNDHSAEGLGPDFVAIGIGLDQQDNRTSCTVVCRRACYDVPAVTGLLN